MSETWTQERPTWCPHTDCLFRRRAMDSICGGELPTPTEHDGGLNTHRVCLNGAADDGRVFDLQVNASDLGWLRWIFDALDGLKTSWLSRESEQGERVECGICGGATYLVQYHKCVGCDTEFYEAGEMTAEDERKAAATLILHPQEPKEGDDGKEPT